MLPVRNISHHTGKATVLLEKMEQETSPVVQISKMVFSVEKTPFSPTDAPQQFHVSGKDLVL